MEFSDTRIISPSTNNPNPTNLIPDETKSPFIPPYLSNFPADRSAMGSSAIHLLVRGDFQQSPVLELDESVLRFLEGIFRDKERDLLLLGNPRKAAPTCSFLPIP